MKKPKATVFKFASYKFEPEKKRIFFTYEQKFQGKEPILYQESIILPEVPDLKSIPQGLIKRLLEGLHLVMGVSYWKFYCATKIEIPYTLAKKEADFWNKVYKKGLGEFFYRNKLDPAIAPKFPFDKKAKANLINLAKSGKFLVGISGGKDSVVAAEILKQQGIGFDLIFTETQKKSEFVDALAAQIGGKFFKVQRFLDWQVFEPHEFDGHIPISAVYAFLGILCAVLYRRAGFIVANEYSSNFGNIKYKGETINHQWSKSGEFEAQFQDYLRNFISPDVAYFSLLRPFYEIRIAKLFSKYKKYFLYFSSCNKNFTIKQSEEKNGLWCGNCPKCAFTFLILSAFLEKGELVKIFGKNLFDDQKLLPLLKDILGFGKLKPFDCVGTFEESRAALFLSREKFPDSLIVKEFLPKIKNPERLLEKVFRAQSSASPDHLKFLGMKNALILGYGREGKITEGYLKKNFPGLEIGIADQKISKDYLKNQINFDIAIKAPGISKKLVKIPYTTATNIFFNEINGKGNKIIGVTGSKGKSTTTSLIYEILKQGGKNVEILGNIGKPMLQALLNPIPKDRIFVIELSSQQLEDLNLSPDIAVVTNLFPEHMDYHGSLDSYYSAKKNIINFQGANDIFVYDSKNRLVASWIKDYTGKAVPFERSKKFETSLIGEHNKDNIAAAVAVAKIFGISDSKVEIAIKNFKPLPHRLEFVGVFDEIRFYDDAISTTPESTIMAIRALKNVDTIFLGGQDRGYNFSQLEKTLKKYRIKNVVLFPDSGKKILKNRKMFNVLETRNMEEAVKFAFKFTKKGKVCLLSCASPSYSLWKDFEEKGNRFQEAVKKLVKKLVNEKAF